MKAKRSEVSLPKMATKESLSSRWGIPWWISHSGEQLAITRRSITPTNATDDFLTARASLPNPTRDPSGGAQTRWRRRLVHTRFSLYTGCFGVGDGRERGEKGAHDLPLYPARPRAGQGSGSSWSAMISRRSITGRCGRIDRRVPHHRGTRCSKQWSWRAGPVEQ
jgi:hypothetical protein